MTIDGSGFGAAQGNGYVDFSDNGIDWGSPGSTALTIDSWSDTAITFTVPTPSGTGGEDHVWAGTPASVTVVDNAGAMSDSPELSITPTADPADYYDNAGISDATSTACANYDGDGYSYSAQALAAAGFTPGGTVSADGLTFTWPDVASCATDNILAAGQTMLVNGTAGASTLGLLESSTNGGTSAPITINYTDGTSTTETLASSDWANGPAARRRRRSPPCPIATGPAEAPRQITMYVYATTVPIDSEPRRSRRSRSPTSVTAPVEARPRCTSGPSVSGRRSDR